MNFLFLNIHDQSHPDAGESAIISTALARGLYNLGHTVTYFASSYPRSSAAELVDGIKIIRDGDNRSTPLMARKYWHEQLEDTIDVVVDTVAPVPFHTHRYIPNELRVLLAPHLTQANDHHHSLRLSINASNKHLQPYKNDLTVTFSPVLEQELLSLRFKNVKIIPPGFTSYQSEDSLPKTTHPTWLYYGPINQANNIEDIIEAFSQISEALPTAKLWLATSSPSPHLPELKKIIVNYGVADRVRWFFNLSPENKNDLFQRAWTLIMTSAADGGQLTILQANKQGTPAIVYDRPYLREIIEPDKTGVISRSQPKALALAMARLAQMKYKRQLLSDNAQQFAQHFSESTTTDRFLDLLADRL
ncbi:MAG: glycosyltransferase family 4 protein [Patescibacteria group bacterium]